MEEFSIWFLSYRLLPLLGSGRINCGEVKLSIDPQRTFPELPDVVQFPEVMDFLFRPSRYKVAYGGRGSTMSWSFARALLLEASQPEPKRILCTREVQRTIQDSVMALLKDQIVLMGLSGVLRVWKQSIKSIYGSDFIFAGLKTDPGKVKSTEGVDICWVEQAEKVSEESWQVLIPTIRKPGSEIWITFNTDMDTDPTYKRFVANPPKDSAVRKVSYRDNPWFPDELKRDMEYLKSVDLDAYRHVYEGEVRKKTKASIFGDKYVVESFEPQEGWNGPYQGADWGFAQDPATLLRCWIGGEDLYIEHETYEIGVDIDILPSKFAEIPDANKYVTRADSARPETISYMRKHGFPKMKPCEKGPGSVEDGIAFLRTFKRIVIHPRCVHTEIEAKLYSYKVDPLTQDILPEIVDKHNHCWDPIRYALEPLIKTSKKKKITIHSIQRNVSEEAERKKREVEETKAMDKPPELGISIEKTRERILKERYGLKDIDLGGRKINER